MGFQPPSGGGGDVSKVGTPVDNQVGVWTGDGIIEGTSGLTYDGSNLLLTGDIGATGTRITKGWFTDLQVTNAIAGSITGNAATVSTITGLAPDTATTAAAQPNITSVGTLTTLQVDNININGNTISSTAGVDLLITPLAGQQIVLDGAIVIDAGVVTGATSITSTSFVGALTGQADTVATITGLAPDTATTQAAQPNITSLGTLTTLTVDTVTINGNAITASAAAALTIDALAGQSVTVEGVTHDGGAVGGVTTLAMTGALSGATTGAFTAASSLTLGTASSAAGGIIFQNATNANTVTIQSGVTSTTYTMTLPTAVAGAGEVLTDVAGDGVLSWAAAAGGVSWNDTRSSGTGIGLAHTISASAASGVQSIKTTVDNTQTNALVVNEIDLGTSAVAHIAWLINAQGASTSQRAIKIDMGSNSTGISAIDFAYTSSGSTNRCLNFDNYKHTAGNGTLLYRGATSGANMCRFFDLNVVSTLNDNFSASVGGNKILWRHDITAASTRTDNLAIIHFVRDNRTANAGATLNAQGSVLHLQNTAVQTSGTLNDTVGVLKLTQDVDSTGPHINFNSQTNGSPRNTAGDLWRNADALNFRTSTQTINIAAGANKKIWLHAFDDSDANAALLNVANKPSIQLTDGVNGFTYFSWNVPSDFTSISKVEIYWTAPVASGNGRMQFVGQSAGSGETTGSEDTLAEASYAVSGSNALTIDDITAAMNGLTITADDMISLRIFRDGGDASDTLGTVLSVYGIQITYT